MKRAMQKIFAPIAAGALLVAVLDPACADGSQRVWRSRYSVGVISRDVITPYYLGYYGSHYSYLPPDPVPPPTYVRYIYPPPVCVYWTWGLHDWIC
jgi:hypothetical protein